MAARKLKPVEAGDGSYGGMVLEAFDRLGAAEPTNPRLLAKLNQYIEGCLLRGKPVTTFNAPCCGNELRSLVPTDPAESWDSLTTCPHCDGMFLKISTAAGVVCRIPDGEAG